MFSIKKTKQEQSKVDITMSFAPDSKYFEGHFLSLPVLPGFIQIQLVMDFSKEYFKIKPTISNIKKLKFTKIIEPHQDIRLILQYDEKYANLTFEYSHKEAGCSSGTIYLKDYEV